MATFYSDIYQGGQKKELGIGTHYNVNSLSMVIPEGQRVKFYDSVESSGDKPTFVWYAGVYQDMNVYGIPRDKQMRVIIEETPLLRSQMALAKWWVDVGTGGKNFRVEVPLTTEHGILNLWTGSGTGGTDFLNDAIEVITVPEGLTVKLFKDHLNLDNPQQAIKNTPGLVITGPKEVNLWSKPFDQYGARVSAISIGGVEYKLLSMEVDESSADWKAYTTLGGKERAENNTPLDEASVGVEISYEESTSQSDSWEAGFGIEISNETKIGTDAMFVNTTFGVTLSVNASFGGEKGQGTSKSTSISANAVLEPFSATDVEAIVEMKRGKVDAIRRWLNMETGAVIEQKGTIEFDQYADATTRFSNFVKLDTPEARAYNESA